MGLWIAIFSLFCGFFLQFLPSFPKEKIMEFGKFYLIYLVLPALALLHIPPLDLSWNLGFAPVAAWLSFLLSWCIFGFLGKKYQWSSCLTGCLILVCGLANTSFLGFPIVALLYGKEALATAFLIDQAGSFLIVSTLGVYVGSKYGQGNPSALGTLVKMLKFPPFIFLVLGLLMSLLQLSLPDMLLPVLNVISSSMAPVALGVIGLSITFDKKWIQSKYLWLGLGYRLLLAPAFIWALYAFFMPTSSLVFKVTVLESGMAPMITGSLLAMEFELQPKLAALLAGLGIPLSAITLLIWHFLLG
jgi:malate permease and related proteins